MKRGVLMIANDFPPVAGAGVQRTVYFAKYLPEFAWRPVVLTVKDVAFPAKDPTLLGELPNAVKLIRTESLEFRRLIWLAQRLRSRLGTRGSKHAEARDDSSHLDPRRRELGRAIRRWFFVPDDRLLWAPFAVARGLRLVRRGDIGLIYSTVPAYSTGVIGYLISRITGCPLVLDLRDPWTRDPYLASPTIFHRWLNSWMEAATVRRASRVVVISEAMRNGFRRAYPQLASGKLVVITNGYDAAKMAAAPRVVTGARFVVAYVGSLYAHHREALRSFLEAWARLAETNRAFASNSALWLVGRYDPEIERELRAWSDVPAEVFGYRPHEEGLGRLKAASVLLLLIKDLDPETELVTIPGKLFEYMAAGPPILMIGPESDAARIVRAVDGTVHAQGDLVEIARTLEERFDAWREDALPTKGHGSVEYERRFLTERLAIEFEAVVRAGPGGDSRPRTET